MTPTAAGDTRSLNPPTVEGQPARSTRLPLAHTPRRTASWHSHDAQTLARDAQAKARPLRRRDGGARLVHRGTLAVDSARARSSCSRSLARTLFASLVDDGLKPAPPTASTLAWTPDTRFPESRPALCPARATLPSVPFLLASQLDHTDTDTHTATMRATLALSTLAAAAALVEPALASSSHGGGALAKRAHGRAAERGMVRRMVRRVRRASGALDDSGVRGKFRRSGAESPGRRRARLLTLLSHISPFSRHLTLRYAAALCHRPAPGAGAAVLALPSNSSSTTTAASSSTQQYKSTAIWWAEAGWIGSCGEVIRYAARTPPHVRSRYTEPLRRAFSCHRSDTDLVLALPYALYPDPSTVSPLCGTSVLVSSPSTAKSLTARVVGASDRQDYTAFSKAAFEQLGGDREGGELAVVLQLVDGKVATSSVSSSVGAGVGKLAASQAATASSSSAAPVKQSPARAVPPTTTTSQAAKTPAQTTTTTTKAATTTTATATTSWDSASAAAASKSKADAAWACASRDAFSRLILVFE